MTVENSQIKTSCKCDFLKILFHLRFIKLIGGVQLYLTIKSFKNKKIRRSFVILYSIELVLF
jgi:hypothetical protein